VSRGQRGGSRTVINLSFIDWSRYFSFKQLLSYPHEAEWTPFQTHSYSEYLAAPGIQPETSGFAAKNSDHLTTYEVENTELFVKTRSWEILKKQPHLGYLGVNWNITLKHILRKYVANMH
jgi:hypothetical protein